jgi:hypothetical protein
MTTAVYYCQEATRCRALAAASPDSDAAKQWLRFAADYNVLAGLLHDGEDARSPVPIVPAQGQPVRQQAEQDRGDKE